MVEGWARGRVTTDWKEDVAKDVYELINLPLKDLGLCPRSNGKP